MNYSMMTERETEIELGTSAAEGITSFAAHDRLIENGRNMPEKTYAASIPSLILAQVKNLYTVSFLILGFVTLVFDTKDFAAWILFFLMAIMNGSVSFVKDLARRRAALAFDERRADIVRIIRDGKQMESDPTLLVKGDIIILSEGDVVPADARILECENLKVDESIFRRSSVPITKRSDKMDTENDMTRCKNMLYCGSNVLCGWAKAAITETGSNTALGKLTESKSKKLNTQGGAAKNSPIEKMLVLAALIAACAVMITVSIRTGEAREGLFAACAAAVCFLPAAVGIVREAGMKKCAASIKKIGASPENDEAVYTIGAADCLVIDKGKMLTDSEIKLEEKEIADKEALCMAAMCSDCEIGEMGADGGDLDSAAVNAAIEAGFDVRGILEKNERVMFKPFDDAQKLMASLHKTEDGYRLIVKGEVEIVPMFCTKVLREDGVSDMDLTFLGELEQKSSDMAEKGLKVRTLSFRDLSEKPEKLEDVIHELIFAGIFGYREIIAPNAAESVKRLKDNFVATYVVTGDHLLTATALAKKTGVVKSEKECMSCRALDNMSSEERLEAIKTHKVFAHALPSDRVKIVTELSKSGCVTAVAGDNMAAPSVAMCANLSFGKEDKGDYDVPMRRLTLETVSKVIARCRNLRSNMAAASSSAVSIGLAQALVLIFAAFTAESFPASALGIVALNLFIAFLPFMVMTLFARTNVAERGRKAAASCALHGFVAALAALWLVRATGGFDASALFCAHYAAFEAVRLNFVRFEGRKFDTGDLLYVALLLLCVILARVLGGIVLNITLAEGMNAVVCALFASVINAALSFIKIPAWFGGMKLGKRDK